MTQDGLARLRAVMDQLRSPGGCPWDAEQTHESLVQYLVEETYETVDAIDSGDREHLLEELGDLLLQVFFHARIAEESELDPFSIDDVAHGITNKLVRRHPHVFPDEDGALMPAADASDVEARWQQLKAEEKSRTSVTDGVPHSLPALTQAAKLLTRLENAGQIAPVDPVAANLVSDLTGSGVDLSEFVLAALAAERSAGRDFDAALRQTVRDFRARIVASEQASGDLGPEPRL